MATPDETVDLSALGTPDDDGSKPKKPDAGETPPDPPAIDASGIEFEPENPDAEEEEYEPDAREKTGDEDEEEERPSAGDPEEREVPTTRDAPSPAGIPQVLIDLPLVPTPPTHSVSVEIPMARPQGGGGPPSFSLIVSAIGAQQRMAVSGAKLDLAVQVTSDRDGRAMEGVAVRFETVPDGACAFGDAGDSYAVVTTDTNGIAKATPTVKGTGSITVRVTIAGRPSDLFVVTAAAGATMNAPATATASDVPSTPNPYRIKTGSPTGAVPTSANPSHNPYRIKN